MKETVGSHGTFVYFEDPPSTTNFMVEGEGVVGIEFLPSEMKKCWWLHSLKLTAKAPENGWLEYDPFLLGWPIFRCENVSFRECFSIKKRISRDPIP